MTLQHDVWTLAIFEIRQVVASRFWVTSQVWSLTVQVKTELGREQGFSPSGKPTKNPPAALLAEHTE